MSMGGITLNAGAFTSLIDLTLNVNKNGGMKTTTNATKQESIVTSISAVEAERDAAVREHPEHKREIERRAAKQIRLLERLPV